MHLPSLVTYPDLQIHVSIPLHTWAHINGSSLMLAQFLKLQGVAHVELTELLSPPHDTEIDQIYDKMYENIQILEKKSLTSALVGRDTNSI